MVKSFAQFGLIGLYTILIGVPVIAASFFDGGRTMMVLGRLWARWILATFAVRVDVAGLENVPTHAPILLMSNHQSLADIAAIVSTLPPSIKWRFVAKKELVRVPVFGQALLASGHIIIDRGNRERAVASLRRAAERIRAGTSVIVFPEGTRSPDGHLRLFKSGPFHLAVEAQVPIVPVTVSGSQRITPKGELRVRSGRVKIVYGKPIPTRGISIEERKVLAARVRDAIARGYDVAYQGPIVLESAPAAGGSALA
ncbi:MAG: 1-acyl-sn-glycerol-3-phosphate acyltransferase [Deltaproteobacteria bacterium]|nr:1-acyl-sn-glycerol-3-phosphate acyltransferase [Deltaproteobacteria bacterium]